MIEAIVRAHFSIFGDFEEITATPAIVTVMMELFKDFHEPLMPAALATSSSANERGENQIPPLVFSNQRKSFVINFSGNRIDFLRNFKNEGEMHKINYVAENTEKEIIFLIDKIFNRFKKKANRIGVVQQFITKELSEDVLNSTFSNIFNLDNDILENEKREWSFRVVNRIPFKIEDISDNKVNSNIEVTRFSQNSPHFVGHRITIKIDSNTIPENKEDRFEITHIKTLYKEFFQHQEGKIQNFLKRISNG